MLEWLDDGVESDGETYLEMRRRLVQYFDRRNRLSADDLADEALNRIARTLEKDGSIATTPPARIGRLETISRMRDDGRKPILGSDELCHSRIPFCRLHAMRAVTPGRGA